MSPIRIHLGQMPPLLRSIIEDLLSGEPDLVVVSCSERGDDPLRRAGEEQAEMVIAAQGSASGSTCLDDLVRQSPLSIFAISPDGRGATAINMVRSTVALDAGDQGTLADAIRRVAIQAREAAHAALS